MDSKNDAELRKSEKLLREKYRVIFKEVELCKEAPVAGQTTIIKIENDPEIETEIVMEQYVTITEEEIKQVGKPRRDIENWKNTIRKRKRDCGEEYTDKKGVKVSARSIKEPCSCRLKCANKISQFERESIFQSFWSTGRTWSQKSQFVACNVMESEVSRRRPRNDNHKLRRKKNKIYTFTINENLITVCKTFFLNTLCIGEKFVSVALRKKADACGGPIVSDQRGKKTPPNKTPEMVLTKIREHIKTLPATQSKNNKLYLGSHLNLTLIYKLYKEYSRMNNFPDGDIASFYIYSKVFNEEFNYSFKKSKAYEKIQF